MFTFVLLFLSAAITSGTPLLFATLGEVTAERSGVINLGLEGIMLVGALAGFAASYYTGSPIIGLGASFLAGGILAGAHAFVSITLRCSQIVSGLALAILGSGLSAFFGQRMIGRTAPSFQPLFAGLDITVFLALTTTAALWLLVRRTRWGLHLDAVGQNPAAADAAGVNVLRIRYFAVLFGGAMAGVGGGCLSLAHTPMWVENIVAGRGWIAIALVIFAMWDPIKALLGAYLFGLVMGATLRVQALGFDVPVYLLSMAPYLVTILALVVITRAAKTRKRLGAPEALGLPFSREGR